MICFAYAFTITSRMPNAEPSPQPATEWSVSTRLALCGLHVINRNELNEWSERYIGVNDGTD